MNTKYEFVEGDTKQFNGRTMHRIRALVAIGLIISPGDLGGYVENESNLSVYGDAWVYGDARVSGNARVSGDAWVSGNARVSGNAWVYGDAEVYGNARVYGDAWVSGNARVYGDAWVSGNARVSGDAWVYGDARVSGNAEVYGDAEVYGNARVYGDARVSGNAWMYGDACYLLIGPAKSSGRFTTAHKDSKIGVRVNCGCFTGTVKEFANAIEKTHANNQSALEQYRLFCQLIAFNFGVTGEQA